MKHQGTTTAQALGSVVGGDQGAFPAAHTPGPWTVDRLGKVRCEADDGKGFIADPGDGRYYNSIPRDEAVSLANAKLIAAAPDMLAALVAIREYFWRGDFIKADNLAQAAIAKAEGRE